PCLRRARVDEQTLGIVLANRPRPGALLEEALVAGERGRLCLRVAVVRATVERLARRRERAPCCDDAGEKQRAPRPQSEPQPPKLLVHQASCARRRVSLDGAGRTDVHFDVVFLPPLPTSTIPRFFERKAMNTTTAAATHAG